MRLIPSSVVPSVLQLSAVEVLPGGMLLAYVHRMRDRFLPATMLMSATSWGLSSPVRKVLYCVSMTVAMGLLATR